MQKNGRNQLIAAIAVFLLAAILWLRYFPAHQQYERVNFADIPTVDYCVLKDYPRSYDGQIIRLKTNLHPNDMHGWYLTDSRCFGEGDESSTAVSFYEPKSEELLNYMRKFQKSRQPAVSLLDVVILGRFTYKNFIGADDAMNERTHLQFEIHSVEFITVP